MLAIFKNIIAATLFALLMSGCDDGTQDTAKNEPAAEMIAAKSAEANQLFERIFEQGVNRSPTFLTYLGRKKDTDKWDDLSEEFAAETLELTKQNLVEVEQIDPAHLDAATQLSFELMKDVLKEEIEDFQWRLYDYPVNQMFGWHSMVPDVLINQHRIESIEDAESYIGRINAVPLLLEQLTDGLKARAEAGIIPPKFVFPHVIRDSQNLISGAPFSEGEENAILTDFKAKLENITVDNDSAKGDLIETATAALLEQMQPAYESLIGYLTELEQSATEDDGIWKWKRGDEFFNVALKRTTTTDLTADEIHEIGLSEVERIHNEMRVIKDAVGFEGDLSAFMAFMRDDDQFYYPSDVAGKQRYLNEAVALIETMKGRLDELFTIKPKADIQVKAVEKFREQSAGKAFYQGPSEDGSRPGLYYANLYDMKAMPIYQMEALAYHEGIPGHHMQIAIAQELGDIPTFRKFGDYTAYTEGWGLYSELVPKEIGFYSDSYSDFGRLAMELWRACRLVVDTGIHAKKWTRQQGIDYYAENTPNALSDAVKMVERHIVMPSQATAYKIGMLKIVELREAAKAALGDKFDIRGFHDEVLRYGAIPLSVLERKINAWVDAQK